MKTNTYGNKANNVAKCHSSGQNYSSENLFSGRNCWPLHGLIVSKLWWMILAITCNRWSSRVLSIWNMLLRRKRLSCGVTPCNLQMCERGQGAGCRMWFNRTSMSKVWLTVAKFLDGDHRKLCHTCPTFSHICAVKGNLHHLDTTSLSSNSSLAF